MKKNFFKLFVHVIICIGLLAVLIAVVSLLFRGGI